MKLFQGRHFQNAYVTRDVDTAVRRFEWIGDIRKKIEVEASVNVRTGDAEGEVRQKIALLWINDLQVELIQPLSGLVDIYRNALPDDDGLAFHHVCHRVDDWQAQLDLIAESPFPIALQGSSEGLEFIYVDTREWLGHYTEYNYMADANWTAMGGR